MDKRFRSLGLTFLALAWVVAACTRQAPTATPTTAPTVTPVPLTVSGLVRNAITKLPVAGARVQAGAVTALADVQGAFSVPTLVDAEFQVDAPGFETVRVRSRAAFPLVVDLVPDAPTTVQIAYEYERQHEFGREYDLLHPDVQAQFSREEFVRYMEQSRPYDVLDSSVGVANLLVSGSVAGKTYENVAQVPVQVTVRANGEVGRRAWLAYVAKADGQWRLFRGALVWPTPVPTYTNTPTSTPLPTYTSTPLPTRTPYPTPILSPTPYTPLAPGSQAAVVAEITALRNGPGDNFTITWSALRGTTLGILEWPRFVAGLPWYRVQVSGTQLSGWVRGDHIAALIVIPTAVPTATSVVPTSTLLPPTAGRVAFSTDRDGNREVYVMNADGGGLRNLTRHPAQDGDASWSPWRDRLAFASDRSGNNDVFVMSADGSGVTQLTFNAADQIHPTWSPNGSWIAYVSNEDGDWEIFVMSATGAGAVQLTYNTAWDSFPSWSADSLRLAFTSDRDGNYELYSYDLATRAETRLTDNPASDAFPAWSPSGREIAFTSARDGPLELYLLDVTTLPYRVTRLTYTQPIDAANRYAAWSSDGNWLAFTSWRDGNAEIYAMRRDGWNLRNLTNHPAQDESPSW